MSVKTPSEKFLMTVPKPLYDHLSKQAEKLGVTVQDRVRFVLEEARKRKNEHISMHGRLEEKQQKEWGIEELQEICYSIGKSIYDAFAVERKRLQVIPLSDDGSVMYKEWGENDVMIPIISRSFYPLDYSNELIELKICDAAKKVAELENKLLSVCEDGDSLYQAMPFKCHMWYKNGVWAGVFRVCVNTPRTPTLVDVQRVTS